MNPAVRFGPLLSGLATLLLFAACGGGGESPLPTTPEPLPSLDVPFSTEDLEVGDGPTLEMGWLAAIAYTGWIYDPDASDNRGDVVGSAPVEAPAPFRVGIGQLIPGVDQGILGMRVGGRRRIVVPPDLGFGASGTSGIPGNATLLYEIELLAADEVPFSANDLTAGDGPEAEAGQSLSVVYRGWIYDLLAEENKGDLFDSNTADSPYTFTLGAGTVIEGWERGVPGLRVGGVRRLVIPHELGYGTTASGPIPAYSTLLFEVELLAIN